MIRTKQVLGELAVMGGLPTFVEPLHVGRPNIGDRATFLCKVNEMLDRAWLTNNGPLVQEFERRVAEFVGVKHCIAVCNATVALELLIRALELKGEVIVPSFTFVATAHALQWQEITPVFCDIDPATHNIDPTQVERLVTPRTSGIIGVHVWGRACDTEALDATARKRGLKLIFDAAHAFACSHNGHMIGSFGEAEVFSFHATKFFNTFEGGAVVTNNDKLAEKIRLMKNFGFSGYDNVIYIGTNGKMTEICAAMGLTNFESIDEFINSNYQNYMAYKKGLACLPGFRIVEYKAGERYNYQYIAVEVDEDEAGLSRDEIVRVLHAENVLARRYFYPGAHRMEPYRSYFPHSGLLLPNTEWLCKRILLLPTGKAVSQADIERIVNILQVALSQRRRVKEVLAKRVNGEGQNK
jgi:dTDP-4-amino-4,6-dideoxygalactose transaminase